MLELLDAEKGAQRRDGEERTNLQLLEIARFVVHLNLERVDLEQLGAALRLGLVVPVLCGCAVEVADYL
jgi:hypothetical protein